MTPRTRRTARPVITVCARPRRIARRRPRAPARRPPTARDSCWPATRLTAADVNARPTSHTRGRHAPARVLGAPAPGMSGAVQWPRGTHAAVSFRSVPRRRRAPSGRGVRHPMAPVAFIRPHSGMHATIKAAACVCARASPMWRDAHAPYTARGGWKWERGTFGRPPCLRAWWNGAAKEGAWRVRHGRSHD